jgi:hypothetical protein
MGSLLIMSLPASSYQLPATSFQLPTIAVGFKQALLDAVGERGRMMEEAGSWKLEAASW